MGPDSSQGWTMTGQEATNEGTWEILFSYEDNIFL